MEPGQQTPRLERFDLRAAAIPLKARLEENPNDEATRQALVSLYRDAGHLDQAGRYAIGLPGEPRSKEMRAYAAMIAGIKADDATLRRLSRLPDEVTIPAALRTDPTRRAPESLLEDLLFPLWILLIIGWFVLGFTVFISALVGMPGLQTGAVTGLLAVSWATAGVTAYTGMYLTIRRAWAGAAFWLAVTAVICVPTLLGTQALLSR